MIIKTVKIWYRDSSASNISYSVFCHKIKNDSNIRTAADSFPVHKLNNCPCLIFWSWSASTTWTHVVVRSCLQVLWGGAGLVLPVDPDRATSLEVTLTTSRASRTAVRLQARRGLKATNLRRTRTQIHVPSDTAASRHHGSAGEALMKANSGIFGLKQEIFSDFVIVAKIPRLWERPNILFSIFRLSSVLKL